MLPPFKPHNKRRPMKQSTAKAPGITLRPSKTADGCFLVLQIDSQRQPQISTLRNVIWGGSMQRTKAALDLAAVEIAEHQHHLYGDEWDVQDLRYMVQETLRQFVSNASSNLRKLKG